MAERSESGTPDDPARDPVLSARRRDAGAPPSKLWTIVAREYVERVRTRWFLIATIFAPLFFALLLIIPAWLTQQDPATLALYNVTVIDATTTGLGERVAQLLGGGKYANAPMPEVRVVPTTVLAQAESAATADVLHRHASGYLVIDSETVAGLGARYVGRRADAQTDMLQITSALREGIIGMRLERRGLSSDQVDSITIVAPVLRTERLSDTGRGEASESKVVLATFVAFFLYMSIVLYGQSMLSGVIEEKLTRVAEVVISSVRPGTLLAGKVLGVSAVGLTQQVIWLAGAAALVSGYGHLSSSAASPAMAGAAGIMSAARAVPGWWLALVLLFFLLGFVFFGSLYSAVGATVSTESDARQAAQPVILLLVMTVVFIGPVINAPMGTLARVLTLLPFSAPILMPLRLAIAPVPAGDVVASIAILAVACAGVVWIAGRIYRVGLLMYGKRPTLREVARWIGER